MRLFISLVHHTTSEIFRAVPFLVLLFGCAVINALTPVWTLLAFHEQQKIIIDSTLSSSILFGFAATVFAAVRTIGGGLSGFNAELLFVKPVGRIRILASKICGILIAVGVFGVVACATALTALYAGRAVYHADHLLVIFALASILLPLVIGAFNQGWRRRSFGATATCMLVICTAALAIITHHLHAEHAQYLPSLAPFFTAFLLLVLCNMTMAAIAGSLSVLFDTVPCMIFCAVIAFTGTLLHTFLPHGTLLYSIAAVIPDWQRFWLTDAASNGTPVPLSYLWHMVSYTLTVSGLWMIPAFWHFHRKEILPSVT